MKQEMVSFVVERITLEKTHLLSVNHRLYIIVGWGHAPSRPCQCVVQGGHLSYDPITSDLATVWSGVLPCVHKSNYTSQTPITIQVTLIQTQYVWPKHW